MYFQKTKELLDKIKLYADVNYFETNFYDQLIIVQELLKSPTIDYKNHLELERLNKEISKKFILSQKFIGSQERTLSDEVYKILFGQYRIENEFSNEKQRELLNLIHEKRELIQEMQEELSKVEKEYRDLSAEQSLVFNQVVAGLDCSDIDKLEAKGITLK